MKFIINICKKNPWHCIDFVNEEESEDIRWKVERHDINVEILHGEDVKNDRDLFEEMSIIFHFPDYFGYNWDALDECLNDLVNDENNGYVLFVENANKLFANSINTAGKLISTCQYVAQNFYCEEKFFHLVFIVDRD